MNFTPGLKIQYWYHLLIVLGAAGAAAAMTIELKVPNTDVLMLSLGMLAWGTGEWINHPLYTKLVPPSFETGGVAATITSHSRRSSFLGIAFDAAGLALIGLAIYKITQAR